MIRQNGGEDLKSALYVYSICMQRLKDDFEAGRNDFFKVNQHDYIKNGNDGITTTMKDEVYVKFISAVMQTTAALNSAEVSSDIKKANDITVRDILVEKMRSMGMEVITDSNEMESALYLSRKAVKHQTSDGNLAVRAQRVFHGSPFDFDKFDSSHIGEGAGLQSHGWGLYFVDNKKKAQVYGNSGLLYIVNIPDADKNTYLSYDNTVDKHILVNIKDKLFDAIIKNAEDEMYSDDTSKRFLREELKESLKDNVTGGDLYGTVSSYLGSDKDANQFLQELGYAGLSYQDNDMTNYVIFNDEDIKIEDKIRLLKTNGGEIHGFTKNGKVYIDPNVATAETPLHEYAHLWVTALREKDPQQWNRVKEIMKQTYVWNEIIGSYKELKTDDEIADEVVATYSGRRGASTLREHINKAVGDNLIDKNNAKGIFDQVRDALNYFWKSIAEIFGVRYTNADDVADMVLKDFLNGYNPVKDTHYNQTTNDLLSEDSARYHFVGETGAARIDSETGTTLMADLEKAKNMYARSAEMNDIKKETGWETGVDGRWRYAIEFATLNPNSYWSQYFKLQKELVDQFKGKRYMTAERTRYDLNMVKVELHAQKLSDIIVNPTLFAAYPALKDITVKTFVSEGNTAGNYNEKEKTISVNMDYLSTIYDTTTEKNCVMCILSHEIQHAIQGYEGFARGGSPEMMELLYAAAKEEVEVRRWAQDLAERSKTYDNKNDYDGLQKRLVSEIKEEGGDWYLPSQDIMDKGLKYFSENDRNTALDSLIGALNTIKSTGGEFNAQRFYERLAGEQESKAVENRYMAEYDAYDQRTLTTEYDIDPKEQIVLFPGVHYIEAKTLDDVPFAQNKISDADIRLRQIVIDILRKNGIDVITAKTESH